MFDVIDIELKLLAALLIYVNTFNQDKVSYDQLDFFTVYILSKLMTVLLRFNTLLARTDSFGELRQIWRYLRLVFFWLYYSP